MCMILNLELLGCLPHVVLLYRQIGIIINVLYWKAVLYFFARRFFYDVCGSLSTSTQKVQHFS